MRFVVVWLTVENERIWWGLRVFSLGPLERNIPKLERKLLKNI